MGSLLSIRSLSVGYVTEKGVLKALNNVDLDVEEREIFCIAGESGCGKTTLGNAVLGILPPNAVILGGSVLFEGRDLLRTRPEEMERIRGRLISYIPQNPGTSLNPLIKIYDHFLEMFRSRSPRDLGDPWKASSELLTRVGIRDPERVLKLRPYQLSGGMRQRVLIALSIALRPRVVVADEPTSMLDATIQSQVLGLIKSLKQSLGTSFLLITHDMGVIREACDRVAIMYAGEVVEEGPVEKVIEAPMHPYTEMLRRSAFLPLKTQGEVKALEGEPPSLLDPPRGCRFHPRCPYAMGVCREKEPPVVAAGSLKVRCHLYPEGVKGA